MSPEQVRERCPLCDWTGLSFREHIRQAHGRTLRRRSDEQERVNRSRVVWNAAEDDSEHALKSAVGITGLLNASLGECWPRAGWHGPTRWATRINEQLLNDPRWAGLSFDEQRRLLQAGVYALGNRYLKRDIAAGRRDTSVFTIEHAIPLRALTHDFLASDMRVYLRDALLRGEGRPRAADPESQHHTDAVEDEVPLAESTDPESQHHGDAVEGEVPLDESTDPESERHADEAGWADAEGVNRGGVGADWLHDDQVIEADEERRARDLAWVEDIMAGDDLLKAAWGLLAPNGPYRTFAEVAAKLDIDPKTITRHIQIARRAAEDLRPLRP
jgi:hypothetical protein